jgi:TldD protein
LGAAFVNNFSMNNIKAAVDQTLKTAGAAKKILSEPVKMSKEKANKDKYEVREKEKIDEIAVEHKLQSLIEIDKALLATKLKFMTRYFELSTEHTQKYYCNSEGTRIQSSIPLVGLFYMISVKENNSIEQRMNQFGASGGWEQFVNWNLADTVSAEAKMLAKIAHAHSAPREKTDVILSPELVGIASHESCGHPYEADRILGREFAQAGGSFIKPEMIGTRIGSNAVTLVDDPTVENSYGFYLYDDEGVAARRRYLIKEGMINELLHNRETAASLGAKSNGAARANSWDAEPIVRMANTFVLPGDYTFEELTDVRKGIYIKSYMEWNIDDKRFNQRYVGLESYMIRNGELGELVKRPAIEITTPAFWQSVDACGKGLEFTVGSCGKSDPMQGIPVCFGGPHVRLRNIILS